MKINSIEVKNLFSYDDKDGLKIEFNKGNTAVIVGPNNAGKTNLFRVFEFLKDVINGKINTGKEIKNYLYNEENKSAKVTIDIKFDENEKNLLMEFIECFAMQTDYLKNAYERGPTNINEIVDLFLECQIIWKYNGEYAKPPQPYCKIPLEGRIKRYVEPIKKEFEKYGISILVFERLDENTKLLDNDGVNVLFEKEILDKLKQYLIKYPVNIPYNYSKDLSNIVNKLLDINSDVFYIINDNQSQRDILFSDNNLIIKTNDIFPNFENNPRGLYSIWLNEYPSKYHKLVLLLHSLKELCNAKITKSNDKKIMYKLEYLCNYINLNIDHISTGPNPGLSLHNFILKLFDKAIIKFEEVRGYPENQSYRQDMVLEYFGNSRELANYLYYLKNYDNPANHMKYDHIKGKFEEIFENEKITFDIFHDKNNIPKIKIIFKDGEQLYIDRVGSGIFEVLNILSVVIGAEGKVILLDEPALHLHPIYQKKLLKEFKKLERNGNNQVIIITHSPYFVDIELLSNTFRFYKESGTTQAINIYDKIFEKKFNKIFESNERLIRALFADGVLLMEGLSELLSFPILARKIGYLLEDNNIEIIDVNGKKGFNNYMEIMNSLKIPFGIVCDGDTYNTCNFNAGLPIYKCEEHDWTDFMINKFRDCEIEGKKIIEYLEDEYEITITEQSKSGNNGAKLTIRGNGKSYDIQLNVNSTPDSLINELKEYLNSSEGKYEIKELDNNKNNTNGGKKYTIKNADKAGLAYIIAKNIQDDIDEKLKDLKEFIEKFNNES
ncbi:MAG: hypothetical protein PWQ47_1490 [Methanothermococcus sp.]|nr:hypothetical protein [Methanothermococcus sp.]